MQINTNLQKQDYIDAYRELVAFLFKHPIVAGVIALLCLGVSIVPFAAFPLKMGAYSLLIWLSVAVITTQYRTGSLQGLLSELAFQQKIILPATLGITILSWAGYAAAGFLLEAVQLSQVSSAAENVSSMDAVAIGGIIIAASAVCVSQVLPLVLAYFCHGLSLSRQQGEKIWLKLLFNHKAFLAFLPIAQVIPVGMMLQIDISAVFLLAATLYSTFIFFIVFNIQPSAPQRTQSFDMVGQL